MTEPVNTSPAMAMTDNRKIHPVMSLFKFGIPLFIVASFYLLSSSRDLCTDVPLLIFFTAVITLLLAASLLLTEKKNLSWPPLFIIIVATIIRLFFVSAPPQLSDDIYRYYTDGFQLISAKNPYSIPPEKIVTNDAEFSAILSRVNHPDLVTLYPPAAQIVFAAGTATGSITGLKFVLILIDLGTCLLIMALLNRLKQPAERVVLYAWHPLPVLEVASSGHIDSVGIFFVFMAVFVLMGHADSNEKTSVQTIFAGVILACAFLIKLFPVVFLPGFFIMKSFDRKRVALGFLLGVLILTLPFMPDIIHGLETLHLYSSTWEFSGFLFRLLRKGFSSGMVARLILALGFGILIITSYFDVSKTRLSESGTMENAFKAFYGISLAYLLLTPTLHPWYALYAVSFLPFAAGPAGLILTWAVFLAYYILIPYKILGIWDENNVIPLIIFSAPVAAVSLRRFVYRIRTIV